MLFESILHVNLETTEELMDFACEIQIRTYTEIVQKFYVELGDRYPGITRKKKNIISYLVSCSGIDQNPDTKPERTSSLRIAQ